MMKIGGNANERAKYADIVGVCFGMFSALEQHE